MGLIILNIIGLVIFGFLALLPTLLFATLFEDSKHQDTIAVITYFISFICGVWLQVIINLKNVGETYISEIPCKTASLHDEKHGKSYGLYTGFVCGDTLVSKSFTSLTPGILDGTDLLYQETYQQGMWGYESNFYKYVIKKAK